MSTKAPKDHNLYIQLLAAEAIGGLSATKESSLLPSNLIIEDDGRGPFQRFVYPVGGLSMMSSESEGQPSEKSMRRASNLQANIPDVLPIQLPTGKEMPLEASSPKPARGVQSMEENNKNVNGLELPSLQPINNKSSGGKPSSPKR